MTGADALERLRLGNERFVRGQARHPHQSRERRAVVAAGQHPFAVILSCADSRVPPEILFDQGLGDLFTIRNAGNVADDVAVASIEYAVLALKTPLLLVLGHQRCGAVTAALEGASLSPRLDALLARIRPAVQATADRPGSPVENAVRAHAQFAATEVVQRSAALGQAVEAHALTVASAVYTLDTGVVTFL